MRLTTTESMDSIDPSTTDASLGERTGAFPEFGKGLILTRPKDRLTQPIEPKERTKRPFLTAAVWGYLLVVIATWLALRYAGDRSWVGTVLLMAPRWPFAAPLVFLWPWALFTRRWSAVSCNLLSSCTVLFLVMGFRISLASLGTERGELRLLTCNVHRQHFDPDQLATYIASVNPDVITIQGWSESSRERLFGAADWNIRTAGELLVATRYPIDKVTPLAITDDGPVSKGEQGVAAVFELRTPQGPVSLISVHLASPHAGLLTFKEDAGDKLSGNIDRRRHESSQLAGFAESISQPLLMAGDFNTTDDSPIFREHWNAFTDAFNERGTGLGYTYIIGHTQFRIDHVLAGPTWKVVRCWTGPDIGTAHRPLVADLSSR